MVCLRLVMVGSATLVVELPLTADRSNDAEDENGRYTCEQDASNGRTRHFGTLTDQDGQAEDDQADDRGHPDSTGHRLGKQHSGDSQHEDCHADRTEDRDFDWAHEVLTGLGIDLWITGHPLGPVGHGPLDTDGGHDD